jgi:hypothetical protein
LGEVGEKKKKKRRNVHWLAGVDDYFTPESGRGEERLGSGGREKKRKRGKEKKSKPPLLGFLLSSVAVNEKKKDELLPAQLLLVCFVPFPWSSHGNRRDDGELC